METLLNDIRDCSACEQELPLGPRPIVEANLLSKIAVIGQAPGTKVHASGIPWDDASGKRLREWMGVDKTSFYDTSKFALIPMGFCYPGKGKSGDLPPKKICAPMWHPPLFEELKNLKLIILVGQYAQNYYMKSEDTRLNLTQRVANFKTYLPRFFVLPHPSPRNNIWLKKNPWFEEKVVPSLKIYVNKSLSHLMH
ncbi:uracil-DNA glycosylase family protein [Psychroflexus tropicus]|uniref:uracil-DNA glycosylase family protein n=1 Tax=Psychroflexus tropicus TaxID=197345 RepID=UPI000363ED1A|nr:uracil-DNA glycosylase family protein [Psychroflexus tropicus]